MTSNSMEEIRNSSNKLVCRIDKATRTVEIVIKDCKTTIQFCDDGRTDVRNIKIS
ncbi:MAG: hypothetical protein ACI4M0_00435 [Christensenellales bacterium]